MSRDIEFTHNYIYLIFFAIELIQFIHLLNNKVIMKNITLIAHVTHLSCVQSIFSSRLFKANTL